MLILAALTMLATAEPLPPDPGRPRLHVAAELEPGVALDRADVRDIAARLRHIWRGHLDVVLTTVGEPAPVVAGEELRLVVTNRLLRDADSSGLGWIEFVNGEPRSTITISMAAVRGLMRDGSWRGASFQQLPPAVGRDFIRRAVARAAAHEVGHYVLRSPAHARVGLMRTSLTVDDIMDASPQRDGLAPTDVARLRQTSPETYSSRLVPGSIGREDSLPRSSPVFR